MFARVTDVVVPALAAVGSVWRLNAVGDSILPSLGSALAAKGCSRDGGGDDPRLMLGRARFGSDVGRSVCLG